MRRRPCILIGAALAASLIVPAGQALAQVQQPVTVSIADIPADILEVATLGANGQKNVGQRGTAPGDFTFSANDFNAGKAVEVWEVECSDGTRVLIVESSTALPEGCKKRRRLGAGIWGSGARLTATFPSALSSGFSADLYGFGSFDVTKFGRVNDACTVVDGRYASANYTQSSCSTDGADSGYSFGGGATFKFHDRIGLDLNVAYSRPGGPSLETTGTRTSGNLKFDLSSDLEQKTLRIRIGPTFAVGEALTIVPFISLNRYTMDQKLIDSLLAGTPQQKVLGGTTNNDVSGFYAGFGARVECQRWYGRLQPFGEFHYGSIGADAGDVFGPDADAPWPTGMNATTVRAGVKVRLTNIRAAVR